jgi:hypothetical protein
MPNDYQQEQLQALQAVQEHLASLDREGRRQLREEVQDYLQFREDVDCFLKRYFAETCTTTCYRSRMSACCSRDGIITFFGDTVVNVLVSSPAELALLASVLKRPNQGFKCVYLGEKGCLWKVRPSVCAMFLCEQAQQQVFSSQPSLKREWDGLRQAERRYKWPDRPVLFDSLEAHFIQAGIRSTLMHLHYSPGLLRVKKEAGLIR